MEDEKDLQTTFNEDCLNDLCEEGSVEHVYDKNK